MKKDSFIHPKVMAKNWVGKRSSFIYMIILNIFIGVLIISRLHDKDFVDYSLYGLIVLTSIINPILYLRSLRAFFKDN